MKFESFFKPKSKEELQKQVENASSILGTDLVNETVQKDIDLLDIKDLKEKYKLRYNTYLDLLRAQKNEEKLESKDFSKAKIVVNALNNLDKYIEEQESGERNILRGRQIPVFNAIRDFLEKGLTDGYVKLPTGAGKTVLFSQIIEAMNLKTLVAVPSLALVKQTSDRMDQFTSKSYGVYTGAEKDTTKDITTITYASLINALKKVEIKSEDFPLFILDEAHKALGLETSTAVDSMQESIKIGFSATPEYSDKHKVSNILEHEIYSMELSEAIKEGLVNRTKTIHAYTDVDISSVSINHGDYDQKELEKFLNVRGRNIAALELYQKAFDGQKAIINCTGVDHAIEVARLFTENGISAKAVYGNMPESEKKLILGYIDENNVRHPSMIETGEVDVLTNAKILLEGFDEQSISVALNLRPVLSFVEAEQRGGRACRIDDNNPHKWAYVIDFIDQNSKRNQVLFSEILGGDKVEPEISLGDDPEKIKRTQGEEEQGQPRDLFINFNNINIDNLRVVVGSKEILEVTKEHQDSRESWTYETLRKDVIDKGIKSSGDYAKNSSPNKWPVPYTLTKMPEFPKKEDGSNDWDAFLETGRERKTWTYETLRADVLDKGIKSSKEYGNNSSKNKWFSKEILTNMPEFPKKEDGSNDWDAFLENIKFTYETLRADVLDKGIKSSSDYAKKYSQNKWPKAATLIKMPEFPKKEDGSNDWDAFLETGREVKTWTYETLRKDVIDKGIKSSGDYDKNVSKNKWPAPRTIAKMPEFPKKEDGSNDWDAFLETKKLAYENLREDILSKGIKSSVDYLKNSSKNKWPALRTITNMPEFPKKEDGSNDWDAFLETGREVKTWTYETLRKDVIDKGIKSSGDYEKNSSQNKWPASVTLKKMPEFPKKEDGSNDWDKFLGKK